MSARREFSRKVRAQIVHRATDPKTGQLVCEGCGLVLGKKPYQVDHTLAEEFVTDKSAPLTADDGKLLGQSCCHAPKTANDIRMIRKADRCRDKHSGAFRKQSRMPGSRDSNIKIRLNGPPVDRRTGLPISTRRS